MKLSPREIDKLILHQAGVVAQKRYARGVRLNYVESVSLISTQLLEFIRDGESVAVLMSKGKKILGICDVLPGVPEMLDEVQVEGTFPDGSKLVTVHHPICNEKGDEELALYASGLKKMNLDKQVHLNPEDGKLIPGEYIINSGEISLNHLKKTIQVTVINKGDRPVQVGSHFPFFEVNPMLEFDREKTFGYRLNIPSGTAVRFESGETKMVHLVELGGEKKIFGANDLIQGEASPDRLVQSIDSLNQHGFLNKKHT